MRSKLCFCVLALVAMAYAKNPKPYLRGKLLQMDSVACGSEEKNSQGVAAEMLGTDSNHKQTREVLCQEYVLQTDDVNFRVRPRDEKHPVLLPVGEWAQFRFQKDKLILRVDEIDDKEREYTVVSMTPRADGNTADAKPARVNHLQ